MAKYGKHFSRRGPTPQSQPIVGQEHRQVKNSAGGYVYELDDWGRLDRFLILGAEGGTYYARERELTVGNAQAILRCLAVNPQRTIDRIAEISHSGRAPKNEPALFALTLAISHESEHVRKLAAAALPRVARIPTHLYHFIDMVQSQRGWGRLLKTAVGDWYLDKPIERLAQHVVKYRQRDGWAHRDLLRLAHPKTDDKALKALFDWSCRGMSDNTDLEHLPEHIVAFEEVKAAGNAEVAVEVIKEQGLPREAIPTELLNEPEVWKALLADMPMTAMIRNLGKMTSIGVLKPMSEETNHVLNQLRDKDALQKARVHPFAILLALKTYAQGRGMKGSLTWEPVSRIVDALDDAYYDAFHGLTPTGKRFLLGVDVSYSMAHPFMDSPLEVCEAAAAMAMIVARTEEQYHIMAFHNEMQKIAISASSRMTDVLRQTRQINMGGTDCALPMVYALGHGIQVDAFMVLTDNETWAGRIHPVEALREYRQKTGIPAKLIVCGMTSTGFTIADPEDAGMLDVVGFDAAAPQVIADFIRG